METFKISLAKFLTIIGIFFVLLSFNISHASAPVCEKIGNTTFCDDGTRYEQEGDTIFGSDGSRYEQEGNTTFGSDGSRYEQIGNTTFVNDGSRYEQFGNQIFGSDGSRYEQIGNQIFNDSDNTATNNNCPRNSSYNSSAESCICNAGYTVSGSSCIYDYLHSSPFSSYVPVPEATCPLNSHESPTDSSRCSCDLGFQTDTTKTKCIASPSITGAKTDVEINSSTEQGKESLTETMSERKEGSKWYENIFSWFKRTFLQNFNLAGMRTKPLDSAGEEVDKLSAPTAEKCRPETFVATKVSRSMFAPHEAYFENVISTNAPLTALETVRKTLIKYKKDFINNPDPFFVYMDSNADSIIAHKSFQMEAYDPLYQNYIIILNNWIAITDKIIVDKIDNGCIDGKTIHDFGVPISADISDYSAPLPDSKALLQKQEYERETAESALRQKQLEEEHAKSVFCSNYQIEKDNIDEYASQNGVLFSGYYAKNINALKEKYAECF